MLVGEAEVLHDRELQRPHRRMHPALDCFSVSSANQRWTRLSHEAPVGVKCT